MNVTRITRVLSLSGLLAFSTMAGMRQAIAAQATSATGQVGMEVLTRGPVHEAFAETITFDPQAGMLAPKAPPAAIEEVPPLQRPEGKNVSWIPGYWGWDDERNDFLWISGIWRALPPGRQWEPGYWAQSRQGIQWTSGYWADASATDIQYLPAPPATIEQGPSIAAPSPDQSWLPGCWVWLQNRYAWRPGYWALGNQDWDWVPDHYVWTPSGYVFVDGYYDYSVPRRGIVFAPVYFVSGSRNGGGLMYSPSIVINADVFASHLFLRSGYGHYYFGDYYGANYANAGFSPWFSYQSSRRGYDPIYANQRWQHRQDGDWEHRTATNFNEFRDHADTRPPHTWLAQQALETNTSASNKNRIPVATPLDELARRKVGGQRIQAVNNSEQQQFSLHRREYSKFVAQRQELEGNTANKSVGDPASSVQPGLRKLPRSPFVSTPVDQLGKDYGPPKRHEVLKPELQSQPQFNRVERTKRNTDGRAPATSTGSQQNQQAQRKFNQQDQQQVKPQGASTTQVQGEVAKRPQTQGASNGQSQNSSQGQSGDKRKKKDND
jgi:hypothetical protein